MKRKRLSIDLDAYPVVRDMILLAEQATGSNRTTLTIRALEKCLGAVVNEMASEQAEARQRMRDWAISSETHQNPIQTVAQEAIRLLGTPPAATPQCLPDRRQGQADVRGTKKARKKGRI